MFGSSDITTRLSESWCKVAHTGVSQNFRTQAYSENTSDWNLTCLAQENVCLSIFASQMKAAYGVALLVKRLFIAY
jgi:hypothetical protein